MIRKLLATSLVCGVILLSLSQYYYFLKKRIVPADLKRATEKRIGSFLKVPVRVDRISVGLLKHISLSGVEINRVRDGSPVLIGVKNIVVRYNLFSFLKRNFRIPAEIFIDTPHLTFQKLQFPGNLFEFDFLRGERGIITRFEFEEGEIQLPWLHLAGVGEGSPLRLVHVEGRAVPKRGDKFDVRFKSRLVGAALGSVLGYGEIGPKRGDYHLELSLQGVALSRENGLPIDNLNGTLELENGTVRMRKLKFLFRKIPCELSGEIRNVFSEKPVLALSINLQERKLQIHAELEADFEREMLSGVVRVLDRELRFSGQVVGGPADFRVHGLKVNGVYQGSAEVNVERRVYRLELEREGERLRFDFSIGDFAWQTILKLDHHNLFGYDLVTYAIFDFKSNEEAWQKGWHMFDVEAKTDYLIFEHQLLRDFKMKARFSLEGFEDIVARWGNVSELRGKLSFHRVPHADLILRVGPLSLAELESFGVYPLLLEGILEGKLEIRGPVDTPSLNGVITVEKGKAGSLDYDRAVLNFSGQPPYLLLKDSKVWKGSNSFLLTGGLNFGLRNFLEGVQINNSEHVVIWKGLELSNENLIRQSRRADTNRVNVEAEYQLGDRTSLRVTAEEDQAKKEYLAVGPKLKF